MTNDTRVAGREQSSMLPRDGVKTPSILGENESSQAGVWYRFKQRCSRDRFSAPPAGAPRTDVSTGWKPRSMTAPVLVPIAVSALCIAAAIEYLAHISRVHGGLALVPMGDSISQYAMISYLYLPTVIAVIFSLVWNWVDLGVKRMQPWFELSKTDGATAQNSLFLDYPYDFVGLVPFKAFKRRHWPVFLSSTVVVAIFWLVTPLQSSILGTKAVRRDDAVSVNIRSRLAPMAVQDVLLDSRVLVTAYSIVSLGQDYPPWMTDSYAILPFYVDNDPGQARPGTNWTAKTTKLTTELECQPAVARAEPPPSRGVYNISLGHGCSTEFVFGTEQIGVEIIYSAWTEPISSFPNLADYYAGCPRSDNAAHQFLAIWAEQTIVDHTSNQTAYDVMALYCQSHFFQQEISVAVAADTLEPYGESIVELGPRSLLSDDDFKSDQFEALITEGTLPRTQTDQDIPYYTLLDPYGLIGNKGLISYPSSYQVGFALAGRNESIYAYRDPERLQQAFNHARKYLFSSAVSYILANETEFDDHAATSSYVQYGIVVSRLFSAVVEILLVVSACCILALLGACRLSMSRLQSNPSSLSRHVRIFQKSQAVNKLFYSLDCSDNKSLSELFPGDRFRLSDEAPGPHNPAIERISDGEPELPTKEPNTQTGYYKPFRPLALRRVSGIVFALVQIGAIVTVQILKGQEMTQQGLTRPSNNFEVLQLLENFIPTIFATLTEPVLVQLNRFLCVLQPFKALATGRSVAANSVDITYASFPPQLVFWRALRARHFLLAFMCITAFLSNVLAVGMSALFKEVPTAARYTQEFRPTIAPRFNGSSVGGFLTNSATSYADAFSYKDHLYLAMANITLGRPLPPWTSTEYFFQPHVPVEMPIRSNESTFVVETRGFGAVVDCIPTNNYVVPEDPPDSPATAGKCFADQSLASQQLRGSLQPGLGPVTWAGAVEIALYYQSECSNNMTYAWGRVQAGDDMNRTILASFADCRPSFQTAMFNVTHDVQGNVISYKRTSDLAPTLDYPDSAGEAYSLLAGSNAVLTVMAPSGFHNNTVAGDWMNYFLVERLKSRDILDASKPVPDAKKLAPFISDVYARLFALLLSLNPQLFEAEDPKTITVGTRIIDEQKIFMATPAYLITTIILGLNVVAVGFFYTSALVSTLPRMPTSIGSMLAYVASSRMVQEGGPQDGEKGVKTYSFGRYMGVDNEPHLGIDVDPYVALIDPDSLKERKPLLSALKPKRSKGVSVGDGPWI